MAKSKYSKKRTIYKPSGSKRVSKRHVYKMKGGFLGGLFGGEETDLNQKNGDINGPGYQMDVDSENYVEGERQGYPMEVVDGKGQVDQINSEGQGNSMEVVDGE